jgi:Fe-S-cluster containining protein
MAAFCLGIHARYQCRHAGACCQNWTVPAEARVVQIVEARKLRRAGFSGSLFLPVEQPGGTSWNVARDAHGDCVFFERDGGRLCVIHREAGIDALPAACRHFPRKILRDARGTFISLSHFCPTAAGMLLTAGGLEIVEARPPLDLPPPLEGLDARDALPPLVRPGLLCDLDGYQAWEQAGIATFARGDLTADQALSMIAAATDVVRGWQPREETLVARVAQAFHATRPEDGTNAASPRRAMEIVSALSAGRAADLASIDRFDDHWTRSVADHFAPFERPMKNYLAARLFANWIAYQGRGLRSIVEWLRTCAAVARHTLLDRALKSGSIPVESDFIEAVRSADLLFLHVLDTAAFAKHVAPMEGPDPR